MDNLIRLEELLKKNNLEYKLRKIDPTKIDIDSTVKELGIKYSDGLSTLLYKKNSGEVVAILRRDDTKLDQTQLKLRLGKLKFCDSADLAKLGFSPGVVSPLLLNTIPVYIDDKVLEMTKIVCGSGSPEYALEISKNDFLNLITNYELISASIINTSRAFSPNKVIVDKELITKFLNRGVENIYPLKINLEKKLLSGEKITAYMGFDPTGPYLHVGHAMGIRALRILQQLGHEVIFLVGDYTARVGDPDKESTRKLLTPEIISKNMAGWKEQAGQLIDFEDKTNPVRFLHNFDWLSKLSLEDIIKLMATTTVQQMLERDLFAKRIKENKAIELQEFIYPLMQGYDSVAMKVDLELGGTDQIFNMLVGRHLVNKYLNKEKFVRAHKMMPAPDGITMSKTKGNGINLGDSANNMYGIAMSYPDSAIIPGFELLTDISLKEIAEIQAELDNQTNPMQFKKLFAYKIVEVIKGTSAAAQAQLNFEATIQNKEISASRVKISLNKLTSRLAHLNKKADLITIIAELAEISKAQAKILHKQNGLELNSTKLDPNSGSLDLREGDILKIGKRNWFEIVD